MLTNDDRSDRALDTLAAYCRPDGEDRANILANATDQAEASTTFDQVVSDLIADLTHLADRSGHQVDWVALAERGTLHYRAEVAEENGEHDGTDVEPLPNMADLT